MKSKKILKVKVISLKFVEDFEKTVNRTLKDFNLLNREIERLDVFSKEGKLVAVIQYREYLDEIDNLPDVVE